MWDIVRGWVDQTNTLSFLLIAIIILLLAAVLSDPRAIKRLVQIVFTLVVMVFLASAYFYVQKPIEPIKSQPAPEPEGEIIDQ